MLKDIYSAGLGSGLPNPNLLPEHSRNWNLGYTQAPGAKTVVRAVLFCSEMANIGKEVHQGAEVEIRTTPIQRLTLTAAYSFLNRTIKYDFGELANVSTVNTSISILPSLPRNTVTATAALRLPYHVTAIANVLYEGGLTVQDTTYATTSPLFLPFAESFATVDLGFIAPIYKRATIQAGVKNVMDRNYFYTAGYPEEVRNWYVNLRYRF